MPFWNKVDSSVASYYENRGGYKGPLVEYEKLITDMLCPGKNLLDIGCGRTFPMAEKWLKTGARICGVDPVADLKSIPEGSEIVKGNAEKVPYNDAEFDVIVSCAVFEHLQNPERVFNELCRALKPGGSIVILTPSKYDYVSLAAQVVPNFLHGKVVKSTEGREEDDTFPTFYKANSLRQIKRLCEKTGLKLNKFNYLDQSPYALSFNPVLYRLGCFYHYIVRSIRYLNFLKGWMLFVVIKPEN